MINAYKMGSENLKIRNHLKELGAEMEDNIKMDLK
jgi:hypothetical protein